MPTRREFLIASSATLLAPLAFPRTLLAEAASPVITVYKSPDCECCGKWVKHLAANGFVVTVRDVQNVDDIKKSMRVPVALQSCHTAVVGRYVIEGHVPADVIKKLLAQKPAVQGLAAPGMPMGSPGMESSHKDKYDIIAFTSSGKTSVFASR